LPRQLSFPHKHRHPPAHPSNSRLLARRLKRLRPDNNLDEAAVEDEAAVAARSS